MIHFQWFVFDHFLLIYGNEHQGFGAEAPKPQRQIWGATMIPEKSLKSVDTLPDYSSLGDAVGADALLKNTVVLKLNGGLGTGMG